MLYPSLHDIDTTKISTVSALRMSKPRFYFLLIVHRSGFELLQSEVPTVEEKFEGLGRDTDTSERCASDGQGQWNMWFFCVATRRLFFGQIPGPMDERVDWVQLWAHVDCPGSMGICDPVI